VETPEQHQSGRPANSRGLAHATTALGTSAPRLAATEVERLVRKLYAIDARAEPLAAERDQNCLVHAASGERYVLKISNPSEPMPIVDFQIAALDHVARMAPSLPLPRVVRTIAGRTREAMRLPDGSHCTVRMLTYVDGLQARETAGSAAQRRAMATCLAELDIALAGFVHPAAVHDLLWNVATAHRLRDKLEFIANPERRAIAALFMDRFTTNVLPRLPALRAQVIHNDYHLYNVLVAPDDHARVCGIIDFGDMVWAPLVGEVATAASYHMESEKDPFAGASEFIGAYHASLPLMDGELEVLPDLVATRHLITLLISEWRASRYAENRAYIMRHNPSAWQALSHMAGCTRDACRERLLANLSSPGDPHD
jgi:Ser/Thr protein kinase RdoA (MazF antagonist)